MSRPVPREEGTTPRVEESVAGAEPVACALSGTEQAVRVQRWQEALTDAVREPLAGGVRLRLPSDRAGMVAELFGQPA